MRVHPFFLESTLSVAEYIRRLRDSIAEEGTGFIAFPDWVSGNEYYGAIDDNQIELRKRRGFFWRNDAAPHLFATLADSPRGTRIKGYFGLASRLRWARWFGLFLLVIVDGMFLSQGVSPRRVISSVVMALFIVVTTVVMPRAMYYLSDDHEEDLLRFVRATL
ncbi:MAG TPA: hypothetical protein VH088_18385 [Terriglobales bacterium]|nr:hypothetical protein [Terriglobales bacterium]